MKLLLLNHNLREHGTYFRAFHFGRELVRQGHKVTLVTASPEHWYRVGHDHTDGMEIIETPSWNPCFNRDDGFGPLDVAFRSFLMLRRRWDAMYAFAHPPNVLIPHWIYRFLQWGLVAVDWCDLYGGSGGIVSRRRKLWDTLPESRPTSAIRRRIQKVSWAIERRAEQHMALHAPRLTVISSFLYHQALYLGVDPSRVLQLPSGAPADMIRPLQKSFCRSHLAIDPPGNAAVLVYIANYHPDEVFFLRSIRVALNELQDGPDAKCIPLRLYVVGPPFSEGKLEDYGIQGIVREMGRRPFNEIPEWLGAADALLLPYPDTTFNRSRWPNKIGDYLASGRPVVTNRTGDFVSIFHENEIGIATKSDPEAYGHAIAEAVRLRHRWGEWGKNARQLAEGPLSWERLAKSLASFWLSPPPR